jgi:hypothetical protein
MKFVDVDASEFERSFTVATRFAATREAMEAVTHDEELERAPSRVEGLVSVRVVNLARELPDDAFDDVGVFGHPRLEKVSKEVWKTPCEADVSELQAPADIVLCAGMELFGTVCGLGKRLDAAKTAHLSKEKIRSRALTLVPVPEVEIPIALGVPDAPLERCTRENEACRLEQTGIAVHRDPLRDVSNLVTKEEKQALPILEVLAPGQERSRDVLGGVVRGQQEGMLHALDEHGLAVREKPSAPLGSEFVGDLPEALAALPQIVAPLDHRVGSDMELPRHASERSLGVEIEISRAVDDRGFVTAGTDFIGRPVGETFSAIAAEKPRSTTRVHVGVASPDQSMICRA